MRHIVSERVEGGAGEGNLAPPPLLKGGEGVRGREGTLGNSRKASMFARNGSGCPRWAMIINE